MQAATKEVEAGKLELAVVRAPAPTVLPVIPTPKPVADYIITHESHHKALDLYDIQIPPSATHDEVIRDCKQVIVSDSLDKSIFVTAYYSPHDGQDAHEIGYLFRSILPGKKPTEKWHPFNQQRSDPAPLAAPDDNLQAPRENDYQEPTPEPVYEPQLHTVAEFNGDGTKTTESFKIVSKVWRIDWVTRREGDMSGTFSFNVRQDGDNGFGTLVANVMGYSHDHTIMRGSGDYYLDISSTLQNYDITVTDLE